MGRPKKAATGLRISDSLTLPLDAVTETFAIIARRGRGKTYTASVLAEELIGAGMPVLIIDPLGVWWGLRSSVTGTGEGLPVVIFGGDHADVPLTEKAGVVIAGAVVEGRFPAVLDLSTLSKSAMRRFMADFVEELYHRNREPLHVIFDEADLFAPQRTSPEGNRLLGAMEDLQRRGRARGIGTTLITQRPAVLHKDLLSQAECLIALSLTGPRDVAAIDEWVRLNADDDEARTVKQSLASLPIGTAWVWSPSWLGILEQVQIRTRSTFDSSATPKAGTTRPTASRFAPVDTTALGARVAALEEEAAATDPRRLRSRIAELEKQLSAKVTGSGSTTTVEVPVEVRVEVPVLDEATLGELRALAAAIVDASMSTAERAEAAAAEARVQAARFTSLIHDTLAERAGGTPPPRAPAPPADSNKPPRRRAHGPTTTHTASGSALPKAQKLILTALAQHGTLTVTQIAKITGYSHKSGGYRNALSALRTAGWITGTGTGTADITDAGLDALGPYDHLPTGAALLDWWKQHQLGKAERAIVDVLAAAYPDPVPVDEIAQRTGYSAGSGGFRNALSHLRSLELASGRGELTLAAELAD